MFKKKHRPRCFWRCLKKPKTSCSRCILTMFFKRLKKYRKISYIFSNTNSRVNIQNLISIFEAWEKLSWVFIFGWITKILLWPFMEFLNPKTSWKTSCFFLNDAMFWRCFWKNIDVDVFDDVLQNAKHRANDASNDVNRPPLGGGEEVRGED